MSCAMRKFARHAVEEVAGDRLARRERDRVHEPVEAIPGLAKLAEQPLDLRVVANVALEGELGAELGCVLGNAVFEALALVAERQLGALSPARPRDAVGNRAVVQHAGDQQALAGQESHGGDGRDSVGAEGGGFSHAHGPARAQTLAGMGLAG